MKTLIVDANVAIKWFLPEIHKNEALRLLNPVYSLHVPNLFLLEFGNVVAKKLRRHEISLEVAHQVIEKVQTIPLKWHLDAPLFPSAFDLAHDTYRSLYDCLYLSLAIAIDGQMVTADLKFYEHLKRARMVIGYCGSKIFLNKPRKSMCLYTRNPKRSKVLVIVRTFNH